MVGSYMVFDWSDLAFGSKSDINKLSPLFIAAPRELSTIRLKQLVRKYLPEGNILLGIAKEPFIDGFEGQPQFKTLQLKTVLPLLKLIEKSPSPHKLYLLSYFQRDLPFILEKIHCRQAVLINGSWKYAFHNRPEFYTLTSQNIPYSLVSPFSDDAEAIQYAQKNVASFELNTNPATNKEIMNMVEKAAAQSFDYTFQTGAILAKKVGQRYKPLCYGFNKVVPYQTFAMHFGSQREKYFAPPNDLNHYDTVHAEVMIMLAALQSRLNLAGASLFINLLPCPTCSRMLAETDLTEIIYQFDHSSGYALKLLETAGKKVTRLV